ncbi:NADPH-dependent FMN reductase [Flavicella sediminum]|uniref:NADPH-dependent FMN reductase n=1 Tax=Flavicella sediminum TaxID=2585141 RepID=UPI001123C791|nr:NAD(P)H-dependent oxidoreductase [Flavicella sediminum]
MKNIIALGGSTSKKSINKALAVYAASQLKNVDLTVLDLNDFQLPLYSVDIELEEGMPSETKRLNAAFDKADGFVVSLAEHNGAYTAAFKNAFDWLSRINGKVWREKPVLLMATSPGARGGLTVLEIAAGRFPYMGAQIAGQFSLPSFFDNFKEEAVVEGELKADLFAQIDLFQKAIDL